MKNPIKQARLRIKRVTATALSKTPDNKLPAVPFWVSIIPLTKSIMPKPRDRTEPKRLNSSFGLILGGLDFNGLNV
jgi:hypothetical protein